VPAKIRVPVAESLPRERLESRLADAWRHRLTLVIAPAGSGKTTLVARFAAASAVPVGWYRAETWDADEGSLVRHLEAALVGALPDLPGGWATVEDAARALEAGPVPSALLVIDDGHALEGTAAEAALGRLVDYAPPWLAIVIAGRVPPSFNLPRLRVSGELLELGTDDLRFRAWEVEQLFRDVYHDPVPPADLATLARRIEGWAAGLQLFHLATRGRSVEERRRILGVTGGSGRLLREYLAQNVMIGLPEELRRFLVDTCVLGRLSGPLCDRLRGASGSGALLDELARRGVFTVPVEDSDDAYRYHEVLRGHLDRMLVEEIGETGARERHAQAGALLEADGALPEALRAYCRAADWEAVRRLLGGQGEQLAAGGGSWVDAVPPAIEHHDPWVALAAARRARNDGRWATAAEAYQRAEAVFGAGRAADAPRHERLALAAWMDPGAIPPPDAAGVLRAGLVREPAAAVRDLARVVDPAAPVARGLLALAAGEVVAARRLLAAAADAAEAGPLPVAAARLGAAVAAVLAGEAWNGQDFDRAAEEAERAGVPWLARLGRELGRRLDPSMEAADGVHDASEHPTGADAWSGALLALASAWTAADPDAGLAAAESAARGFRKLGAGVPEAWSRALAAAAVVRTGAPDAREAAVAAESLGRATGTPAARMLAYAALGRAAEGPAEGRAAEGRGADGRAAEYAQLADAVRADIGLALPPALVVGAPSGPLEASSPVAPEGEAAADARVTAADVRANATNAQAPIHASVRIRTLGGCGLDVDGRRASLDRAKPRVRSLMRLLAIHAGAPVHREVIQEALWPESDADAGARSLHVAVSALRRLLDDVAQPVGGRLVVRDGDAYRLDVPPDSVDLGRFDRAIAQGRAARSRGEVSAAAFSLAMELYAGELLPEEGPADWVIERREHYRAKAIEAAIGLAEEAMLGADYATAVRACRFGLELDRYQDALWRMLIDARDRAGDAGAATRDRREYASVLEGLGVEAPVAVIPF
jgi:DNA-binding SARP family transcriptional activator